MKSIVIYFYNDILQASCKELNIESKFLVPHPIFNYVSLFPQIFRHSRMVDMM